MSFELTNSFLEEFDFMFYPFLQQQGSQLMQCVTPEAVTGDVKYIRLQGVGQAHWVTETGGITEYTPIKYDRRRLKPRPFVCPIMLNDFDMVKQGTPDPGALAAEAANSCGVLIDELIIQGLGGTSYTESGGQKTLPGADKVTSGATAAAVVANYDKTQTIAWNDATMGGPLDGNNNYVNAGLSTAKINKAVTKLRAKHNFGPIVCVASNYANGTLRADKRVASSDFNDIHAFMAGANLSYGGVAAYVTSEKVDGGKSKVGADGKYSAAGIDVEYAYVFCMNQIKLGASMPLTLKNGLNAERYLNNVLIYQGMYDCTRMFEESVVRIEINRNPTGNIEWAA